MNQQDRPQGAEADVPCKSIADEYAEALRKKAAEIGADITIVHDEFVFETDKEGHAALMEWSSAWFREKLTQLPPIEFRAEPTTLGKWRSA